MNMGLDGKLALVTASYVVADMSKEDDLKGAVDGINDIGRVDIFFFSTGQGVPNPATLWRRAWLTGTKPQVSCSTLPYI